MTSVGTNVSRIPNASACTVVDDDNLANEMDDMMVILADNNEDTQISDIQDKLLSTVKLQEDALKKLGNVRRHKLNRKYTEDHFDIGQKKLKNMVVERKKEIVIEKRKLELMHNAVAHYKQKMATFLKKLEEVMASQRDLQP